MPDRTVHGTTADGGQIVRYDRAGKWYVEYKDGRPCRHVTVQRAADLAVEALTGVPGGRRFDALVTRRFGETT